MRTRLEALPGGASTRTVLLFSTLRENHMLAFPLFSEAGWEATALASLFFLKSNQQLTTQNRQKVCGNKDRVRSSQVTTKTRRSIWRPFFSPSQRDIFHFSRNLSTFSCLLVLYFTRPIHFISTSFLTNILLTILFSAKLFIQMHSHNRLSVSKFRLSMVKNVRF